MSVRSAAGGSGGGGGGGGGVTSFNGRTGAVLLSLTDVTGALGYTPLPTVNPTVSGNLTVDNSSSPSGANLILAGNGVTTPNKYLRAANGIFALINHTYTASILTVTDAGAVQVFERVSRGALGYTATNVLADFTTTVNAYNQVIVKNGSNGATASANFIVNNDISTDTTFFGEFGMNSSGFTLVSSLSQPNAIYLSSTSADLVIGTMTNNLIRFVINNNATDVGVIQANGLNSMSIGAGNPRDGTFTTLRANTSISMNGTSTLILDAANQLAQRNATTAQVFRIYGTFTDASNYERLGITTSAGDTNIYQEQLGIGTARNLQIGTVGATSLRFVTNNTVRWFVNSTGLLAPNTDGTLDAGGTANRIRSVYLGTSLFAGVTTGTARLNIGGAISAASWTTVGIGISVVAATYTNNSTGVGGTAVTGHIHAIAQPTIAATNTTVTTTTAATLFIAGAPIPGTNMTITNPRSLLVGAGISEFGGGILLSTAAAPTAPASTISLGNTTATTATAGASGATPAQVLGYWIINVAGTTAKVPYYAN